ncbi:prealbumin-like fold domain-containing protein [uncultured Actinomyces sp.]|uniref:prealbumin-like fold domain-containing protein n=1 Tax=uncultured Actinomyces sp. TaxID=249061 RepID=UPI0028D29D92|nr:prealbumin-like fold domain-containing protein [uncultured Actinomyces sp.]
MTNAKSQATSKRRTAATRFVAALAVAATAGSALVGSQIVAPQAAYAAQEPAATKIDVGDVRAVMGKGVTNNSETDTSTDYNNEIRYGIVKGMSTDRIRTGNTPLTTYLGGEYAKNNDAWTYIARGMPWKWDDYNPAYGPRDRGTPWRQSHYDQWARAGADKIWVNGQSAIGFKPNNPGQVEPGQTFLLGAIRHNNLPIQGTTQLQPYLHSDLSLQFPGLIDSDPGEAFPLLNNETRNTLATTIMYRKGGAYVKTAGEPGTGTCSSSFGINGWDATQKIGGKWPRDVVLSGDTYGRPGYTPSGSFIGPAYEPQPIDSNDRSKGYVNLPETRSGRIYCVKYVGEGNGEYDLYSQYYNAGAGQPFNTIEGEANLPRTWPGAKGNVNENPYVYDTVKLSKTVSDKTFVKNGRTYRMHLWGFVPATNAHTLITPENITNIPTANCPASPAPDAEVTDTFITQELSVNYACLYGVITEERTVRIAKSVEDPSGVNPTIPAASFGVTTGTTWRDSTGRTPKTTGTVAVTKPTSSSAPVKGWFISSSDSATLTPTGFGEGNAKYDSEFIPFEVGNSDFTISENQIADQQWKLKDIKCVNGIGEDVAVTKTERGVSFKNVGGAKSDAAAPITCTFVNEYEAPKVPNLRVQKSIENNGGLTGATEFDVDYKIVATNDGNGAGNTGKLTDKPDFAKGLEIQSAKVATTQAGLAGATNATASGGVYTLTNGVNLDPGKTAEFWIRFHVKRNETAAGYDVKNLECKVTGNNVPTPGFGLFNQVVAENGKDSDGEDNNKACGPVPVSKMRVEKSIQVNGATTGATDFIVDYKIVATNDGNTKASTGKLTDKPDFAKGLEIQSAKVASTQAALTGAAIVTPANGVYTLTNGVELDPGKTAEFWIRFQVKRNESATGYDVKNLECKLDANGIPTAGYGLFNQVVAESGKDHDGEDNNKACGPVPVTKIRVQKSIEANGGANTGATEFDVDYKIVATNDGNLKTSTGILTDKPEFAKGLEIQSAKVATTQAGLAGAANATAANGTYTLTNGVDVEPGKTAEFWIRFHVKFNSAAAGYDETALECKLDAKGIPTAGFGLFNQVNAQTGKDHDGIDNNKACGPYVPAKVRVEKSIEANGGATGAAEFDVDYKIVATNDGQIATTTGKLTDKPEFAKGLEIQSAKIATTQAGLAGAANATAANGVYTLTTGVTLQPGTTAEFWIRFHVKRNTAAAGYSETNLACHLDQKNLPVPGFGLFNQVYAENGKDHDGIDNNKACGPNVPHEIVVVKAGTQNTGKTFTDPTNQYTSGDGSALYPLSGAEFAIYSGGNPQSSTSATLVKTLSAGATTDVYYWSVTGLELNTDYWLVETKAPAGHSLLPRPIPFRLTTDGNGTVVTLGAEVRDQTKWANSAVQAYASVTNATLPQSDQGFVVGGARKATILVKDTEVGHLPVSGSLGIYPYIGVAMALMGGAMVISLVTMKQRRKAENFA